MKTSYLVLLFTVSATLCLSSCSKKSDDVMPAQTTTTTPGTAQTTPTQSTTQPVRVKVEGNLYTPDMNYALTTSPGDDNYFGVYGLDSKTGNLVALLLPKTVGVGTFPIVRRQLKVDKRGENGKRQFSKLFHLNHLSYVQFNQKVFFQSV